MNWLQWIALLVSLPSAILDAATILNAIKNKRKGSGNPKV